MSTISCKAAREQLLDYVEHELPPSRHEAIHAHLGSCSACTDELREIERLRAALAEAMVPDPGPGFWQAFPEQVLQAGRAARATRRTPFSAWLAQLRAAPRFTGGLVAAAALVVLGVGIALVIAVRGPQASSIAAFQTAIHVAGAERAPLVVLELPAGTGFGFAPQSGQVNYFRAGHEYARALAEAAHGDPETARRILAGVTDALGITAERRDGGPLSVPLVAALEPELERAASEAGARQAAAFRAGGRLASLSLAVAARDSAALRAAGPEIVRLRADLDRVAAPPGAARNVVELQQLLDRTEPSERDYEGAARLIRETQLALM